MNYLFTLLPAANISTEGLKPRVAAGNATDSGGGWGEAGKKLGFSWGFRNRNCGFCIHKTIYV